MEKSEEGIVIAVDGGMAKVKIARHSSCENCGSCPGASASVIDAQNIFNAKPGQRVEVKFQEVNMLKAAFVVYMLPLFSTFAGAVGGSYAADYYQVNSLAVQITGGIVGFLTAAAYVWYFDRSVRSNHKMLPVITRIL